MDRCLEIDGDLLIVGAPGDNTFGSDSGAAYVFVRTNGIWHYEAKLTASDGSAGATFGQSVAVSGSTVYVGSVNTAMIRVGEVFKAALAWNSAALIVVHNHPSGAPRSA